jgi:hypothetical protein
MSIGSGSEFFAMTDLRRLAALLTQLLGDPLPERIRWQR